MANIDLCKYNYCRLYKQDNRSVQKQLPPPLSRKLNDQAVVHVYLFVPTQRAAVFINIDIKSPFFSVLYNNIQHFLLKPFNKGETINMYNRTQFKCSHF